MLTKRENLMETIHGGRPDRFVNQFEAFGLLTDSPYEKRNPSPRYGEHHVTNAWGVVRSWPEGTPGSFPEHDEAHIVCKDITEWRKYVHAPSVQYPDSQWDSFRAEAAAIDRRQQFVMPMVSPGVFEQCHYLLEIQECLMAFYEEPEALHELIDYITDWELAYAEQLCRHVHPDGIFHHDDWGSQNSTFFSRPCLRSFFSPATGRYIAIIGSME